MKKFAERMEKIFYILTGILIIYAIYMMIMTGTTIKETAAQYGVSTSEVIKQSIPNIVGQNVPNFINILIFMGFAGIFRILGHDEETIKEDLADIPGDADLNSEKEIDESMPEEESNVCECENLEDPKE